MVKTEFEEVQLDGTIVGGIVGAAGAIVAAVVTAFFALRKTVVEKYFDGIGERVKLLENTLEKERDETHEFREQILEIRRALNSSELEVVELRRRNDLLEIDLAETRLERDGLKLERDELASKVHKLELRLDELETQTSEVLSS